jgi:hypothetical protein
MAVEIGPVHPVATRTDHGWGFSLKDSTGHAHRWITLIYRTEAEATAARKIMEAATAGVIEAAIH